MNIVATSAPNGVGVNNGKANGKKQQIRGSDDSFSSSDVVSRRLQLIRALNHSSIAIDSLSRSLLITRGLTQTVSFSDQLRRLVSLTRAYADTEPFNENFIVVNGRAISDTLNFSDSIARTVALGRGSVDTQVFAEGLSDPPQGIVRIVLDRETFSEDLAFNLNPAARTLEDTFSVTEDFDPNVVVIRLVADSLPTTETMTSFAQAVRALLDDFVLTELPIKVSALTQQLLDGFTFSESLVSNVIVNPGESTTVQFADALGTPTDPATVAVDLLRLENEGFAVTDVVTANVVLTTRDLTDSLSFSDSVVGFINNLPRGVVGKAILNFVQGGGSVKIGVSGGAVIIRQGSGTVAKTEGTGSVTLVSGSGEVN